MMFCRNRKRYPVIAVRNTILYKPGTAAIPSKIIVAAIRTSTPAPLNGKTNAPGNREKKPRSCSTTHSVRTGRHSTPQLRHICDGPAEVERVATQRSQKYLWHFGQDQAASDLEWERQRVFGGAVMNDGASTGGASTVAAPDSVPVG